MAATNELFRRAASRALPVFVATTEHTRDMSTWTLSMRFDDQGFTVHGAPQADLLPGLDVPEGAHRLVTIRGSAFYGADLAQRLRVLGVNRRLLAGGEAENCLALTGRDGFARDFEVAFAVDAIAPGQLERGQRALGDNHTEVRQPLLGLDEVDSRW